MTGQLRPPRALLWDFGGTLVDGGNTPHWQTEVAVAVAELLATEHAAPVPVETIVAALSADETDSDLFWHLAAPVQRRADQLWRDIAKGWPASARAAAVTHATNLSKLVAETKFARGWQLRPGITPLLTDATKRRLPMAVVSNTVCGAVHRTFLTAAGLDHHFQTQLYSDEEGIRKPNPALLERAVTALGVPIGDCWMIGDTRSRDVLAARRAHAGVAVLMRSQFVEPLPCPDVEPDLEVADPVELSVVLARVLAPRRRRRRRDPHAAVAAARQAM
jgi:FMN phosphatase YigB (HAD superfamily)